MVPTDPALATAAVTAVVAAIRLIGANDLRPRTGKIVRSKLCVLFLFLVYFLRAGAVYLKFCKAVILSIFLLAFFGLQKSSEGMHRILVLPDIRPAGVIFHKNSHIK